MSSRSESILEPALERTDRGPRSILYLPRNSWGEIEWVLPILYRLKGPGSQVRIHTVFPCDRYFDEREHAPTLWRLLEEVSDFIHRPVDLIGVDTDWRAFDPARPQRVVDRKETLDPDVAAGLQRVQSLFERIRALHERGEIETAEYEQQILKLAPLVQELQRARDARLEQRATAIEDAYLEALVTGPLAELDIDVILRDNGFDFRLHTLLLDHFRDAPVARGEHGFDLTNRTRDDVFPQFFASVAQTRHMLGRGDVWFACCQNLVDSWRTYWGEERTVLSGYPRLDRWWVERVLAASSQEVTAAKLPDGPTRLLWISRQVVGSCFDQEHWTRVVRATLGVVRDRSDVHLIVKPHPRQDRETLLRELEALPRSRWTLWTGTTLSAAAQSDLVVSVWSSAILDALAVGKPVIEFFEYGKESVNQARDERGNVSGGWRANGLAVPADSAAEVHRLIDLWKRDPEHDIWRAQRAAFARLHPADADHTALATRAIVDLVRARER